MDTSDWIAIAAIVVSVLFSVPAFWQTRGAKAAAAAADARADRAERTANEAVVIARQHATAVEAISATVGSAGPQTIKWQIDRQNEQYLVLRNRGTVAQHDARVDLDGRGGTVGEPYEWAEIEPGGSVGFLLADPPSSLRVICNAEPGGRMVGVPGW